MRKTRFAPGNYYHIYNRGTNKQDVFLHRRDYLRFLFLITHMQAAAPLPHITRLLHGIENLSDIQLEAEIKEKIVSSKIVELVSFALMTNHFHLLLYETEEQGISRYMQRVLNSYSKFFNTKYERSGHLFQGPFGAVHVRTDEQLLYLTAYIHSNPISIKEYEESPHEYEWSSYTDFVSENRWPELLKPGIVLEQFTDGKHYKRFVEETGAKKHHHFDFKTGQHQVLSIPIE